MDSEYGPASMPPGSGGHDHRRAPVQTVLHDVGAFSRLSRLRPLLTAIVIALVLWMGYHVRVWTFRHTASIRFAWDLDNAWSNGSEALRRGRGDFFDGIVEMYRPDEHTGIDYAPLRLHVKTAWVRYVRHRHGPDAVRSDETLYPMLAVNFCFEVLGAIGMYRLCRLFRGPRRSFLAACCLWFNPAVIYNTFAWPQWDIWVVAPVAWATWATLRLGRPVSNVLADCFAGLCLGVGAALKGQILFVAPADQPPTTCRRKSQVWNLQSALRGAAGYIRRPVDAKSQSAV